MNNRIFFKLTILTSIFLILLIIFYVPQHMDEYIMYQSLACNQKQQALSIYREACGSYPVNLGPIKYNLSYIYNGISSSLFLSPFQFLFDSIWTQYFLGVLSLIIIALGTFRSFKFNIRYFPFVLIFFPILYSVLKDGGPIRISLICISWSPFLFRKYLENNGLQKIFYFFLISLFWIISIEDKPFFIYLIPGTILLMISGLDEYYILNILKKRKLELLKIFSSFTFLCILFLNILQVEVTNEPYFIWLIKHSRNTTERVLDFSRLVDPLKYTFYWPQYFHRIVHLSDSHSFSLNNLLVLILGFLIILITLRYYLLVFRVIKASKDQVNLKLIFLSCSFFIFNICIFISKGRLHHHYVFAQYPLLIFTLYFVSLEKEKAYKFLYTSFLSIIFLSFIVFHLSPQRFATHREIPMIFNLALKNSNNKTIINASNWGFYFTYSLSNKKDLPVVYADKEKYMNELSEKASELKANIIHLCSSKFSEDHLEYSYEDENGINTTCNTNSLEELYNTKNVSEIKSNAEIWKLFKIIP